MAHSIKDLVETMDERTDLSYLEAIIKKPLALEEIQARRKAYFKAYYEAHREQRKAYCKAYYEAHREQVKAYSKAYREARREQVKAYSKAYREAHIEQIKAYNKAYNEARREKRALASYRLGWTWNIIRSMFNALPE